MCASEQLLTVLVTITWCFDTMIDKIVFIMTYVEVHLCVHVHVSCTSPIIAVAMPGLLGLIPSKFGINMKGNTSNHIIRVLFL